MKKLFLAGAVAAALTGCGALDELAQQAARLAKLNSGKVTATGYQLAKNLIEVQQLSGGIAGLAPSLSDSGSGVSFAPAARLAPGFRPAAEAMCGWSGRAVTTVTETYTAPEKEEESAKITLYVYCASALSYPKVTTASAETKYKDGSTGTTFVYELDVNDDLATGFDSLTIKRYFPTSDKRERFTFQAEVDLLGSWDAPNAWRYGKYEIVMRDGTQVTAEVKPTAPVKDGDDFTSGTASRTTAYAPGGPLKLTSETAEITAKDEGSYHLVNEYADGTKDDITVTADGVQVTLDAQGHDGYTRTGSLQLASGDYQLVTTFPANMPIAKVTESGKWHKNATQGTYDRTIEWADGHTTETKVTANVNGNTISATFSHEDVVDADKSDRISGTLTIERKPTEIRVDLEISNDDGDKAVLQGVQYADGTASLTYTKDLKETPGINPDEEGTFTFAADGSGEGTVIAHDDGGSTTYHVTINADGTGTITEASGSLVVNF